MQNNAQYHSFLSYFVHHKIAANLLMLICLIAGFVAFEKIRVQFFPDIIFETITVKYAWPGAGAQDVDDNIIAFVEPHLLRLEGVENIQSTASEAYARFDVEYEAGYDMQLALREVETAVNEVTNLPDTVEEPSLKHVKFRDRVSDIVLYGNTDVALLYYYADKLRLALFQQGIAQTILKGYSPPNIEIIVTQAQLFAHGFNMRQLQQIIQTQLINDPSGEIAEGHWRIRSGLNGRSLQDIGNIIISRNANQGQTLYLKDIADIRLTNHDDSVHYLHQSQTAIVMEVYRSASQSTVNIQNTLEKSIQDFQDTLPPEINIRQANIRANAIIERIDILYSNAILGLGLVVMLLFFFLSAKTAFWVAIGMPTAFALTIVTLYALGISLNMISLFALIVCLGIIVDDAIVVSEHSDFLRRQGLSASASALGGIKQMLAPVVTASITTIIAFLSLLFISGRFGKFIVDLPITVAIIVAASLLEAFIILPAHMRHALHHGYQQAKTPFYDKPSHWVNHYLMHFVTHYYQPFMRYILKGRLLLFSAVVALLFISIAMIIHGDVSWRFFNAPERGTLRANIIMLDSAKRQDTKDMLYELQRALEQTEQEYFQETNIKAIASVGVLIFKNIIY
jgi:multidrug efflux pump subunit AcrB